jgi:hypothetical protein
MSFAISHLPLIRRGQARLPDLRGSVTCGPSMELESHSAKLTKLKTDQLRVGKVGLLPLQIEKSEMANDLWKIPFVPDGPGSSHG